MRSAAGGTLFLDEIGDLPIDVQPKLLRFLELQEIMPLGETRPQRVDVRVWPRPTPTSSSASRKASFERTSTTGSASSAFTSRRCASGARRFPHLSTFFLREASERLGKPDIQLSSGALDMFSRYWWPGNVRQLKQRNPASRRDERRRAGTIEPQHLSPEVGATRLSGVSPAPARAFRADANLASAIEQVEREFIQTALDRSAGNISEAARNLGLTRRGLYLKLRRLGLAAGAELDTL